MVAWTINGDLDVYWGEAVFRAKKYVTSAVEFGKSSLFRLVRAIWRLDDMNLMNSDDDGG